MSTAATDPVRKPGRPRTISDDAIYAAAVDVLADHGLAGLTFARVAARLDVTAAAVRQRFGTKQGLVAEVARRRTSGVEECFALALASQPTSLQALEAALLSRVEGLDEPHRLANSISTYVDSATDPSLQAHFRDELRGMELGVLHLLHRAHQDGETDRPPTQELAATVFAAFEGVVTLWAITSRGLLRERVHDVLEIVVGRPFEPARRDPS